MTHVIHFLTVVIDSKAFVGCPVHLKVEIAGNDCFSFLCPWNFNFLFKCFRSLCSRTDSRLLLCSTGLLPRNTAGRRLGRRPQFQGLTLSELSKLSGRAVSLCPSPSSLLLADQGRSTHIHKGRNPLLLPSACARSPVQAPAFET